MTDSSNARKQPYVREIKDSTLKQMLVSYIQYPEYFMQYHFEHGMQDPEVDLGMLVIDAMSNDVTASHRLKATLAVLTCVSVYNETLERFEEFDVYFLKDILGEASFNSLRKYVYTRPAFIPAWKKAHPKLAGLRNLVTDGITDPNVEEYLVNIMTGEEKLEKDLDWTMVHG